MYIYNPILIQAQQILKAYHLHTLKELPAIARNNILAKC